VLFRSAGPAYEEDGGGRRRWPWLALALLLVLGGAALAFALTRPDMVEVPNEVGKPSQQAVTDLARLGFKTDVEPVRSEAPEGIVVSHDPPAGDKAERGSTVTLNVSSGPGTRIVPEVKGKTRKVALKLLIDAKFRVDEQEESSTSVPEGSATRTDPAGGTEQPAGSRVRLYISTGPERVEVPGVVGLDITDARAELEDAGLRPVVKRVESDKPEDEVTGQNPGEGTEVDEGTRVSLTVSKGREEIEVPNVDGETEEAARAELEAAGFEVEVNEEPAPPEDEGLVVRQQPSSGKRPRGSTVRIWIGVPEDTSEPPKDEGGEPGP
jgi:beta-lactam-binding protein with PASTA domain